VVLGKLNIIPEKNMVEGWNFHKRSETTAGLFFQLFTIFSRNTMKRIQLIDIQEKGILCQKQIILSSTKTMFQIFNFRV